MSSRKAADEIFCRSCGDLIKKQAEICPHCGVRNEKKTVGTSGTAGTTTGKRGSDGVDQDSLDDIAPYVAWGGGILLLLAALGAVGEPNGQFLRAIVAGAILCATGLFSLPPVREKLATRKGIRLDRGVVVLVVIIGLFTGAALGPS